MMRNNIQAQTIRKIWMLTREYGEIAGAGGVKDVSKQLAECFASVGGCDVRVVLPLYGFIDPAKFDCRLLQDNLARRPLLFTVDMNYAGQERREDVRIWTCRLGGVTVYLPESDRFRGEDGCVHLYPPGRRPLRVGNRPGRGISTISR